MVHDPPGVMRSAQRLVIDYRPSLTLRIVAMPAGRGPAVTTSTSVRRTS